MHELRMIKRKPLMSHLWFIQCIYSIGGSGSSLRGAVQFQVKSRGTQLRRTGTQNLQELLSTLKDQVFKERVKERLCLSRTIEIFSSLLVRNKFFLAMERDRGREQVT
ncbi:hypothetical protein KIL84_005514 [Mauremys mutica]|uniref:Uncharacterized protein n=1 Tax=Mauremys mutica TaxID=74926 RepID=A0A9D3XKX3_9SAUR|nr:hypothetical protein KIL84_005514 [Mauremys mutica]